MKTLLTILLIGSIAFGQKIEIKDETFTFEKVVYFVQDNSKLQTNERGITCYKMVGDKPEQFYFITDRYYNVLRVFDYTRNKWTYYDLITKN